MKEKYNALLLVAKVMAREIDESNDDPLFTYLDQVERLDSGDVSPDEIYNHYSE